MKKKITRIYDNLWLVVKKKIDKEYEWDFVWSFSGVLLNEEWEILSFGQNIDKFPTEIQAIWNKFHLNGYDDSTKAQYEYLERRRNELGRYLSYVESKNELIQNNLYIDKHKGVPIKWKTVYICREDPYDEEINNFFNSLPDDTELYKSIVKEK